MKNIIFTTVFAIIFAVNSYGYDMPPSVTANQYTNLSAYPGGYVFNLKNTFVFSTLKRYITFTWYNTTHAYGWIGTINTTLWASSSTSLSGSISSVPLTSGEVQLSTGGETTYAYLPTANTYLALQW